MASRLQDVILRGLASARPLATAVAPGTLYYSTDTSTTDRSDGTTWQTYADAGSGTVAPHHLTHEPGGTDAITIPPNHASRHSSGGADPVTVTNLAGFPGGTTNFLRADGTFAAPPVATSPGLVLLESHVASGSASLDFKTRNAPGQSGAVFQSDYDEYLFEFVNIVPASNGASLYMKVSTDGGSTWQATNYNFLQYVLGAVFNNLSEQLSQTRIWLGGGLFNTASEGGNSGFMRVTNPISTTIVKRFQADLNWKGSSDSKFYLYRMIGQWSTAGTAVNAIQFIMDSGNITSGVIRCYGFAK